MTSESSSRYLTFALTVRKLTDALIVFVEEGTMPRGLEASLRKVLSSLENAGERTSVKALRKRGTFGHYENVVTINEVVRGSDKSDIVEKLNRVINARSQRQKRASAIEAVHFFDALERRALYHYSHPAVNREVLAHR